MSFLLLQTSRNQATRRKLTVKYSPPYIYIYIKFPPTMVLICDTPLMGVKVLLEVKYDVICLLTEILYAR